LIIKNEYDNVYKINKSPTAGLRTKTINGNLYLNDTLRKETENGNYVWREVCEQELKSNWNRRSTLDYDGLDLKNQKIKYTIIRYLTSKGYGKDSVGISLLTPKDIFLIESGIANERLGTKFSISNRIYQIIWEIKEYTKNQNSSGHSVAQRLEYWATSIRIIKSNLLIGVGTGDVKDEFQKEYQRTNSSLSKQYRLKSHNGYLLITVAFGLIGLFIFLYSLFYPPYILKMYNNYYFVVFFIIFLLSQINEDTIETQAGVTFFAFFNSLFLFYKKDNYTDKLSDN
jgi:hypothetical protein